MPKTVEQELFIETRVGKLEARLNIPTDATNFMVVLHPHPGHLGTMNNKVVTTCISTAQQLGYATLRFNFRGVGNSEGAIHCGDFSFNNEIQDMDDVWQWLQTNYAGRYNFSFTGFSFGSFIAAQHCQKHSIANLTLIAPPIKKFDYSNITNAAVIQGTDDEITDSDAVKHWANSKNFTFKSIESSHFFHGKLLDLKLAVTEIYAQS